MHQPMFILSNAQAAESRQPERIVVPPRVSVASQILHMLNQKQSQVIIRIDGTDGQPGSVERIAGEKLTEAEDLAHNAAADVLAAYLQGTLKPDAWEEAIQSDVVGRAKARNESRGKRKAGRTLIRAVPCPQCGGAAQDGTCDWCHGDGQMLVVRRRDL